MTFIYEVTSDVPLALGRSIGNVTVVTPHDPYNGLIVRDQIKTDSCGPQCAPATITLELKDRTND